MNVVFCDAILITEGEEANEADSLPHTPVIEILFDELSCGEGRC